MKDHDHENLSRAVLLSQLILKKVRAAQRSEDSFEALLEALERKYRDDRGRETRASAQVRAALKAMRADQVVRAQAIINRGRRR